jgi:hypothetical protein
VKPGSLLKKKDEKSTLVSPQLKIEKSEGEVEVSAGGCQC